MTRHMAAARLLVYETHSCEDVHILCIRGEEVPAIDQLGYCAHCHWVVKAEVERGLERLRRDLRLWTSYGGWCLELRLEP